MADTVEGDNRLPSPYLNAIDLETTYVENTDSQRLSVNNTTPGSDIREENSDEHDDVQPLAKKMKLNTEEDSELDDSIDYGSHCTICYSEYTNSGDHRLGCLKCGHLFGEKCIIHWLKAGCDRDRRRCPTCNKKAAIKDVRILYARNIIAADTTELNRLRNKFEEVQLEKNKLAAKLLSTESKLEFQRREIETLKHDLKNKAYPAGRTICDVSRPHVTDVTTLRLTTVGGCRILTYNHSESLLIASHQSGNPLYPGYGVRKINTHNVQMSDFQFMCKKVIRDAVFSPFSSNILLCVSIEGCAKLFDVHNNAVVESFEAPYPLWSCCWSENEPFKFYCGSQNGVVYMFDQRYPNNQGEKTVDNDTDKTGVISVHSVKSKPGRALQCGGLIICKLNSVYACEINDKPCSLKRMPIAGNFTSMRFDNETDHILVTARPGSKWPATRHMLYRLSSNPDSTDVCELVHIFYGARDAYSTLSRSSFVTYRDNSHQKNMIAAHNTYTGAIDLWDIRTYEIVPLNVRFTESVLDICAVEENGSFYVCCLTDCKVSMIQLAI